MGAAEGPNEAVVGLASSIEDIESDLDTTSSNASPATQPSSAMSSPLLSANGPNDAGEAQDQEHSGEDQAMQIHVCIRVRVHGDGTLKVAGVNAACPDLSCEEILDTLRHTFGAEGCFFPPTPSQDEEALSPDVVEEDTAEASRSDDPPPASD